MLLINFIITHVQHGKKLTGKLTQEEQALREEKGELAAIICNLIYVSVGGCLVATTVYNRFMLEKSWDNVSVRCGTLLIKAAMLASGDIGPFAFFCMLLQVYNFALIVNKRRDSQPGATFPIQVIFTFLSMTHYFLRTSHRERINSIKLGKVCPGGIECSTPVHYTLLIFELFAPYLIGHMIMPLTVKARVLYAYSHLV